MINTERTKESTKSRTTPEGKLSFQNAIVFVLRNEPCHAPFSADLGVSFTSNWQHSIHGALHQSHSLTDFAIHSCYLSPASFRLHYSQVFERCWREKGKWIHDDEQLDILELCRGKLVWQSSLSRLC